MNTRLKTLPNARIKWSVDDVPAIGAGESKTIAVRFEGSGNDRDPRSVALPLRDRSVPANRGGDDGKTEYPDKEHQQQLGAGQQWIAFGYTHVILPLG